MRFRTKRLYLLILIMLFSILLLCPATYHVTPRPRRMAWALGQGESIAHARNRWEQCFPYCRIVGSQPYYHRDGYPATLVIEYSCPPP